MNARHLPAAIAATIALIASTACLAADTPTTRPAAVTTKPAAERTYIKVTAPLAPDSKEIITCLVDVNDAPEFKDWGVQAANYALKCYPTIDKRIASPGYTAPREFRLIIKPAKGVAYTTGKAITINTAYLKGHTDDFGMVAHELVHVIQQYRGRGNPGWLVEGVADYVRYFVIEPGAKNARFNPERSNYKGGYQPAAAMLNWIEQKHPGAVVTLNQAMRQGKYTPELFKEQAGGDPDDLWAQFKESLKPKN